MKTINRPRSNSQNFKKPKRAFQNIIVKFERKVAKKLNDLSNRCLKLDFYSEPKIWEKKDRYGNTYYRVYDPKRDRHLDLNSEDEVRWWLDQRYYL